MDAQLNHLTAMWLEKPTKKQIPLTVPEEDQIFNFHCDQNSVNIVKKSLFTIGKYFAVRCGKAQYELRVIDYSWGWDPQLKKKKYFVINERQTKTFTCGLKDKRGPKPPPLF